MRNRSTNAALGVNTFDLVTETSNRVCSSDFASMAWAPVGTRFAVAATFDPATGTAGGPLQLLVHDPHANSLVTTSHLLFGSEALRGDLFAWSPDGGKLAYVTRVAFDDERTWQVVPDGTQLVVRAADVKGQEVVSLSWSPDSTRLALLEHDPTQAFHPGEWHLIGADGRSAFRSGSFFTFATSQQLLWSTDSARAVYAVAAAAGGPDRVRSVQGDGRNDVELSALDVGTFAYASGSLPKP